MKETEQDQKVSKKTMAAAIAIYVVGGVAMGTLIGKAAGYVIGTGIGILIKK